MIVVVVGAFCVVGVCGGTSSGVDVGVVCVVLLWCLCMVLVQWCGGGWSSGVWCGGRWRPIKPQTLFFLGDGKVLPKF